MQLEITLIVSQILAFLIMLWVLKKFAWGPLLKILQERRAKIQSEFNSIEEQKKGNQELTELYKSKLAQMEEEAKQKIAQAVELGQQKAQKIQEEAHAHARELLQKAKQDIELEMQKAQGELKNQIVKMVVQTTQKILDERIDTEKDRKLIAKILDEARFK